MVAREHQSHLVAGQPASFLKFFVMKGNRLTDGVGHETDHHHRGKWPGLAGMIIHLSDGDPGFFMQFSSARILDCLAGLDETGKSGIDSPSKLPFATRKTPIAMKRQP